jgi:hypothetical protein
MVVVVSRSMAKSKRSEASSRTTTSERLHELASDPDWEIRQLVARNKNTTWEDLDKLAHDEFRPVRYAAAIHPDIAEQSLDFLAKDPSPDIRFEVARHKNTPTVTLEALRSDAIQYVAGMAKEKLTPRKKPILKQSKKPAKEATPTPAQVEEETSRLRHFGLPDAEMLARLKDNSLLTQTALSQHKWQTVRVAVAENQATPKDVKILMAMVDGQSDKVLGALAKDPDPEIRRHVAYNPKVSFDTQVGLAKDPDASVRHMLAANPAAGYEVLGNLAGDKDENVRAAVAADVGGNTPSEALERLADDISDRVREQVAKAPGAPYSVIKRLTKDKIQRVALAAQKTIDEQGWDDERSAGEEDHDREDDLADVIAPRASDKSAIAALVRRWAETGITGSELRYLLEYGTVTVEDVALAAEVFQQSQWEEGPRSWAALDKIKEEKNRRAWAAAAAKAAEEQMSRRVAPPAPSFQPRAEANEAAWRVAASQLVKLTREPLVAVVVRNIAPGDRQVAAKVEAFLRSEAGTALLAGMLAIGLSALPSSEGDHLQKLARELRVKGASEMGDLLADFIMKPLRQVLAMYLQDAPQPPAEPAYPQLPPRQEVEGIWTPEGEKERVKNPVGGVGSSARGDRLVWALGQASRRYGILA